MNPALKAIPIVPGLWMFRDTCNVYVLKRGDRAVAIDFGSGRWLQFLPALGISGLDHVWLTHHHADQCSGLPARPRWPFVIHAPAGEDRFLDPAQVKAFHKPLEIGALYPASFSVLPRGIPGIHYDMAGDTERYWRDLCLRFIHTPGHSPDACSVLVEFDGRQIAFCGDAAHVRSTIWEPFHLEWDHWTGTGALAAWQGIQRLLGPGVDCLYPSHGPRIGPFPRRALRKLAGRLLDLYKAKGSICAGEKDHFLVPGLLACGARRYLPHLIQFGGNGWLLVSETGEGLVVDPESADLPLLDRVLKESGGVQPTIMTASHFHYDHNEGMPAMKKRYGTQSWLHPRVAGPMSHALGRNFPFLLNRPIRADHLWPERGAWRWHEYVFAVAPWPGQTWWHCVFMTTIDGRKVLFGGDSFQPASRWNGTGGFCAYNNSQFRAGYIASAQLALKWKPDILANGHQTCFRFTASRFRRIIHWAQSAERAVRALCPSGDLERDYYSVREKKLSGS